MKIVLIVVLLLGAYVMLYSGITDQSITQTINITGSGKKKANG